MPVNMGLRNMSATAALVRTAHASTWGEKCRRQVSLERSTLRTPWTHKKQQFRMIDFSRAKTATD